jgi:hypothetical protein
MVMRIPIAVLVPPAMALALSATCAYAHDPAVAAPAGEPPVTTNATSTTAAALTVVRDKDTGRLRKPTAEEMQAILANARASAAARPVAEPRDVKGRNGASGLFLGEAAMSTQVARRNAKGGLDETCVVGDEAVDRFVKAKPTQRGASHE